MDNSNIYNKNITNKDRIQALIKDIMIITLGLIISSFGTSLFYQAGMGSSAMATFSDGLHNLFNISYGTANIVANILFFLILLICDRKMINIGTYLCVFMIGIFIDIGNLVFGMLPIASSHVIIRFICMIAGCTMMGIGLALYVAVDRGFGALEGLVKYITAKTNISFDKIKIGQDLILLLLGILLRASWGIGTVISAIAIGPIMNVFIVKFQKMLSKE